MTDDGWVIRVCNDPEKDCIERSKKEEMTDDIVTKLEFLLKEGAAIIKDQADEIERLREKVDKWRDLADSLARFGNCESPDCPDCDRDWKLTYQNYEQAVRGE